MRDYSQFRFRLLAAMGLLTAPAACADKAATPASTLGGADTLTDTAVATTDTASTETAVADTAKPDTAAPADPGPADSPAPADTPVDIAVDTAKADTAPSVDATGPDAIADVGPPMCKFGQPAQSCFDAKQLKSIIESPPMGGDSNGDVKSYTGVLPPDGCPEHGMVKDGCCNPAEGPGILQGDKCCYWFCTGACCGRPLMVAGVARTAPQVDNSAWVGPIAAATADLGEPARSQLAAAWRADAADEHASVASFLRFGLDLLAFAAPPELVAGAALAAADEVRHAQTCAALAAGLDGATDGPAALDCTGIAAHGCLADAAAAAVLEGCIGETLASVVLGAAARGVVDPALAATLRQLADDEARHAELAWTFVRWAHANGGADVRAAVAQAFAHALAGAPLADPRAAQLAGVSDADRRAAGRLPQREFSAVCKGALAQIVGPCSAALLAA